MAGSKPSPLMTAVTAYKKSALERLNAGQVQEAIRLLKLVNQNLPGRNLLDASLEEIKTAGAQVFDGGELRSNSKFLSSELNRFYDAALDKELIQRHPINGRAHLGPKTPDQPPAQRGTGEKVASLVSNLIENGIQAGFMVSPLAMPLAEMGEQNAALDRFVNGLSGRWYELANRCEWFFSMLRVAIPIVTILIALTTFLDPSKSPFSGSASFATGNAMQDIKLMVNLLESEEPRGVEISTLEELGNWIGVPSARAAEVFDLEQLRVAPSILYLRHKQSGALIIVTSEHRGTLRGKRWRMLQ